MSTRFLPSRNGSTFMADVETEQDWPSLTILTNDGAGYRSAHRDAARAHFGRAPQCVDRLTWINANNVRVVLTRWVSA